MVELKDIGLYKELIAKTDNRSAYYGSFLIQIEHDMRFVLENNKCLFEDYPDHGIEHSKRVLSYISDIISDEMKSKLSSLEIVILTMAAFFHDSGMALFNHPEYDKDYIRRNHPVLSKKVIDLYFDKCLANLNDRDRIKNAVTFVCEAHGMTMDDLMNDDRFEKTDKIDSFVVRYGWLAFMLRIGDLMDIEAERVNNFRMMLYSDDFNDIAYEHNKRNQNIQEYDYNPKKLTIKVLAENHSQYKIWYDWFDYLKKDIEKFNAIYAGEGVCFPRLKDEINKPDGATYSVQNLRFEIDDNGGMWNIISSAIYTDELDFLRELIQNSIDASLKPVYTDTNYQINSCSPRAWGKNAKPITVCFSEEKNILYVIDEGIGMDAIDLENFLFRVSSTGKVYSKERAFAFPGIAQFGIGFVSCIVNANIIKIFTSKNGDDINEVTLESGRNYAFIEKETNSIEYIGTTISLKLRQKYKFSDIDQYIYKTFKYPSVTIKTVNLDIFEKNIKATDSSDSFNEFIEKPYSFYALFKKDIELKGYEKKLRLQEKAALDVISNSFDDIVLYGQENYINLSSVKTRNEYNRRVVSLEKSIVEAGIEGKFPDILIHSGIKEEDLDYELERLIKNQNSYSYILNNGRAKLDKQIEGLNLGITEVGCEDFSTADDWKYFAIFLDDELEMYNIKREKDPFSLGKGCGILLLKNSTLDYDNGIEYEVVNGFLFEKGALCRRLVKLKKEVVGNSGCQQRNIIISVNGNGADILDEVRDWQEQCYEDDDEEIDYYASGDQYYDEERGIRVLNQYDEVCVKNNKILRNLERILQDENDDIYSDIQDEGYTSEDFIEKKLKMSLQEKELYAITSSISDIAYQDGIAIQWRINQLFPAGLFRIKVNLTAQSRMKLNVTRHKTSEIRSDVDDWMEKVGENLQRDILKNVKSSLEKLDVSFDYENVLWDRDEIDDYFSQKAYSSLKKIFKT